MINKFEKFVEELANTKKSINVHNQYSYDCEENSIRRDNLLIYLNQMYSLKPKIMLVGEAPGYKGCRLTGVPFTSEHTFMNKTRGLDLFRRENGYKLVLEKDKILKEPTATMIWDTLLKYDIMPLSWNAFPFHPHKKDNEDSNRAPLKTDMLIGEKFLIQIIDMFDIEKIVAVGNKAEENLIKLGINCTKVRHPSFGGKDMFDKGMKDISEELNKS